MKPCKIDARPFGLGDDHQPTGYFHVENRRCMSLTQIPSHIEYPESDGKPMGETDLHRDWMFRILEILRFRYRGQRVYIASDLLVYYEAGQPTRFIVPDNFVVLDCDPGRRRIFKTWDEQRVPDVVFEVTSRGTSSVDILEKPVIYERMGVKEYFLYDPTGSYLNPALQGFRLVDGVLVEIPRSHGALACHTLGINLRLNEDDLILIDSESGKPLLTKEEAETEAKEAAYAEREIERDAKEVERAAKEAERAAKEAERAAKEAERAARIALESQLLQLQAEIEQLKRDARQN
jgi:Uma2 family endonuclease